MTIKKAIIVFVCMLIGSVVSIGTTAAYYHYQGDSSAFDPYHTGFDAIDTCLNAVEIKQEAERFTAQGIRKTEWIGQTQRFESTGEYTIFLHDDLVQTVFFGRHKSELIITVCLPEDSLAVESFIHEFEAKEDSFGNPVLPGEYNGMEYIFHQSMATNMHIVFTYFGDDGPDGLHQMHTAADAVYFMREGCLYYVGVPWGIDILDVPALMDYAVEQAPRPVNSL